MKCLSNGVEESVLDYIKLDLQLSQTVTASAFTLEVDTSDNIKPSIEARRGSIFMFTIFVNEESYDCSNEVLKALYKAVNRLRMNDESTLTLLDLIRFNLLPSSNRANLIVCVSFFPNSYLEVIDKKDIHPTETGPALSNNNLESLSKTAFKENFHEEKSSARIEDWDLFGI